MNTKNVPPTAVPRVACCGRRGDGSRCTFLATDNGWCRLHVVTEQIRNMYRYIRTITQRVQQGDPAMTPVGVDAFLRQAEQRGEITNEQRIRVYKEFIGALMRVSNQVPPFPVPQGAQPSAQTETEDDPSIPS